MDTIAVNCLVFEKIAFFAFWRQTDKQTHKQMHSTDALSRSCCCERQLSKEDGHIVCSKLRRLVKKTGVIFDESGTGRTADCYRIKGRPYNMFVF